MNGSQREGRKRLLTKVNVVDAQVQQEAPLSPFFLADSLAAVPQAESSLPGETVRSFLRGLLTVRTNLELLKGEGKGV